MKLLTIPVILILLSLPVMAAQIHTQPPPDNPPPLYLQLAGNDAREMGVNVFYNPLLESSNYLLRLDEEICIGNEVQVINSEMSGEWFGKGGPNDSPPVLFVDDLAVAKQKIASGDTSFIPQVHWGTYCSTNYDNFARHCMFLGQVICASDCDDESLPNERITVTADGQYTTDCQTSCFLYVKNIGGYINWGMTEPTIGPSVESGIDLQVGPASGQPLSFTSELGFQGVVDAEGPQITVQDDGYSSTLGLLIFSIKNTGDIGAAIDALDVPPGAQVLYSPKHLHPGESDDVIVSMENGGQTSLSVAFRADDLGCQVTKEYSTALGFNLNEASDPFEGTNPGEYDVVLQKGIQPRPNLLDLREIVERP